MAKYRKVALAKVLINIALYIAVIVLTVAIPKTKDAGAIAGFSIGVIVGLGIIALAILVLPIIQWVVGASQHHKLSVVSAIFNIFGCLILIGPFVSFIMDIVISASKGNTSSAS